MVGGGGVFELGTKDPPKSSYNDKIFEAVGKSSQQSVDVIPLLHVDVQPVNIIPLFGRKEWNNVEEIRKWIDFHFLKKGETAFDRFHKPSSSIKNIFISCLECQS